MDKEIKIYVADLAAYNNGKLHGIWINATDELAEIQEKINAMLKNSPEGFAEEYAIHDYEWFNGYRLSKYEGIESAHNIACFIKEYPDFGGELLNYFSDIDDARKAAEENYYGCYHSMADYAENFITQSYDMPNYLEFYIDYKKMGRDMELNGDIFTIETGFEEIHVFWNH